MRWAIAGLCEERVVWPQRLDRAADAGGHDRQTDRHRLEHGQRQSFKPRRQNEQISQRHHLGNIAAVAQETHVIGHAKL